MASNSHFWFFKPPFLLKPSPFGPKNLPPIFVSEKVFDTGYGRRVGQDQSHLSIRINRINSPIKAIGFRMGDCLDQISNFKKFAICYAVDQNIWKGKKELQLILKDLRINFLSNISS